MHPALLDEFILCKRNVDLRHTQQRQRYRFDDQVVEADLDRNRVLLRVLVDLPPQVGKFAGVDDAGHIEVRRGQPALAETPGDGAAHSREWYLDRFAYLDGHRRRSWHRDFDRGGYGGETRGGGCPPPCSSCRPCHTVFFVRPCVSAP